MRKRTCTCTYIKYMFICDIQYFKNGARELELGKLAIKHIVEYLLQINHAFRLKRSMFKNVSQQIDIIAVNWRTKIHNITILIKYFF